MTNKEAKEKLYMEWQKFLEDNIDYAGISEAYKMAFKALEQELCEDAVSRQAVLECFTWTNDKADVWNRIKDLPSVTPQSKTGHWQNVEDRTDWYNATYKCSCCGREIIMPYELRNNLYSDYPYCHCGAKMIEHLQESDVKE